MSEVREPVQGDGYAVGSVDGLEGDYGFRKVRRELGVTAFGVNALKIPVGWETGRISMTSRRSCTSSTRAGSRWSSATADVTSWAPAGWRAWTRPRCARSRNVGDGRRRLPGRGRQGRLRGARRDAFRRARRAVSAIRGLRAPRSSTQHGLREELLRTSDRSPDEAQRFCRPYRLRAPERLVSLDVNAQGVDVAVRGPWLCPVSWLWSNMLRRSAHGSLGTHGRICARAVCVITAMPSRKSSSA